MIQVVLRETYDLWREKLIEIVEENTAGTQSVSLWDFSGYNHVNTEEIPSQGELDKRMTYFLDASHYKTSAGDLVLARILNEPESQSNHVADYGNLLDSSLSFASFLPAER